MKKLLILLLYLTYSYYCISQVNLVDLLEELSPEEVIITSNVNQKTDNNFDLIQRKVNFRYQQDDLENLFIYINENERFSIYHMFYPDLFQRDESDVNYVYIGLYDKVATRFYLIKSYWKGYYTYINKIKHNKYRLNIRLPPNIISIIELDSSLTPLAAISFSSGVPTGKLGHVDGFFKFNKQDEGVSIKEILFPYDFTAEIDTYDEIVESLSWIKSQDYFHIDSIQKTPVFSLELGEYVDKSVFSDTNYVFLIITPDIKKIDKSLHWDVIRLFEYCVKYGYSFYWLTSSSTFETDDWKNVNKMQYPFRRFIPPFEDTLLEYPFIENPFYLVDEQVLKKQISNEYGLLIVKNGIVLERWDGYLDEKLENSLSGENG